MSELRKTETRKFIVLYDHEKTNKIRRYRCAGNCTRSWMFPRDYPKRILMSWKNKDGCAESMAARAIQCKYDF